jgi:hypothetical protein
MHLSRPQLVSAHAGSDSLIGIDSHVQQFPPTLQSAGVAHSAVAMPDPVELEELPVVDDPVVDELADEVADEVAFVEPLDMEPVDVV